jgi:pyochelin biosynthesis protein PchC
VKSPEIVGAIRGLELGSVSESPERLLRRFNSPAAPRVRLVCLPYAGGAASLFRAWPLGLPSDIEVSGVQLPARQDRLNEPPLTRMDAIIDRLELALQALPPLPTAIFGHSFGALVAYELAARLHAAHRAPLAVIVGARQAPHLSAGPSTLHPLNDDEFCTALSRRYGTLLSILNDRDMRSMALPPLRADFETLETYVPRERPPLDCAFTVLHGLRDTSVPRAEALAWGEVAQAMKLYEVDAGHFFMDTQRSWVLARIADTVADARRPGDG